MRVAIDYTAATRQGGGIGRYARELVKAILAQENQDHEFVLMAAAAGLGERWKSEAARLRKSASVRSIPLSDDWMARIWQRLRLPIPAELITGAVDCFYSPDFVIPPLQRKTRALLTVHDLSFLRYPDTFPPRLREYLEQAVPRSVARADHILADSNSTRRDIIELLKVSPERVSTLYCGVPGHFTPQAQPEERERLQKRYAIGDAPYILSVGTVQPRKNYLRLIEACAPLAKRHGIKLIIAGKAAWLSEEILTAAQQRPYVQMMGFFEDTDLPALYRQARLFAYPSLYEGFGIPPLEAMACGVPVVVSSASSLPEVVGDAGIHVDPHDTEAWTAALGRGLEDTTLRQDLQQAGLQHAKKFTWAGAAQQWLSVIESIQ